METDVLLCQHFQQTFQVNVENHCYNPFIDRSKWYNLCQASQKLWPEMALHNFQHVIMRWYDSFIESIKIILASDIGGKDYQCI